MTSEGEVVVTVGEKQPDTADENEGEVQDANEEEKSKGICAPDMWYSPKGKSVPCVICLILLWIIALPFLILLAFVFLLWFLVEKCYVLMWRSARSPNSSR